MKIAIRLCSIALLALCLAAPAARAAELTTRDYVEIQQLYARYNEAIDSGNGAAFAALFTPDGEFQHTFKGAEQLAGFVTQWHEKQGGAQRRHYATDLRVSGTPEGARGATSLLLLDFGTKPVSIFSTAVYDDTLVKTRQGWRFKTRVVKPDPVPGASP